MTSFLLLGMLVFLYYLPFTTFTLLTFFIFKDSSCQSVMRRKPSPSDIWDSIVVFFFIPNGVTFDTKTLNHTLVLSIRLCPTFIGDPLPNFLKFIDLIKIPVTRGWWNMIVGKTLAFSFFATFLAKCIIGPEKLLHRLSTFFACGS